MKTREEILKLKKMKIVNLHERENRLNAENTELDKTIESCKRKKDKIAKAISRLVKYRNIIIDQVYSKNKL